jgi:hypothetical protein
MVLDFFDLPSEDQIDSFTIAARALLRDYGLVQVSVKNINYEFNATFSVVTESGEKFALRINVNSTRTFENMLAEVEFVNFLTRVPGIKVPRPVANSSDDFITSIFHADSNRMVHAILYTWLVGEELGDEPTQGQLVSVGAAMAIMHQRTREFELTGAASLPTFNQWLWGTEDFLLSQKTLLSTEQLLLIQRAVDIIQADMNQLFALTPTQVIHGDLHGWNLMWSENGLSIFDFDDCGYGIPHQDLAVTLYYLDTPEQEAAVLEGYASVCELPTYSKQQMASLLLQRRLVLLNYLYETKNPEHKEMLPAYLEKSLERIGAFLTDVRG